MAHSQTFLPPDVLERSRDRERRDRERRARQRRGASLWKRLVSSRFERRDALVVMLVLVSLGGLVRYTHVLDHWFDRFNTNRPDQLQAAEGLVGGP